MEELKIWEVTKTKNYIVVLLGTGGRWYPRVICTFALQKSQQKYIGLCSEELDLLVLAPVMSV